MACLARQQCRQWSLWAMRSQVEQVEHTYLYKECGCGCPLLMMLALRTHVHLMTYIYAYSASACGMFVCLLTVSMCVCVFLCVDNKCVRASRSDHNKYVEMCVDNIIHTHDTCAHTGVGDRHSQARYVDFRKYKRYVRFDRPHAFAHFVGSGVRARAECYERDVIKTHLHAAHHTQRISIPDATHRHQHHCEMYRKLWRCRARRISQAHCIYYGLYESAEITETENMLSDANRATSSTVVCMCVFV